MIDTPNIPPTSPQTQQQTASSQHTIIKLPEGITSLKAGDILDALVLRHESSNNSLLQISAKNIQTGELPIAHKLPLATNSALQLEVTQAPKNLTDIPFVFEAKIKSINGQNITLSDTQLKQAFDVIKAAIPQHARLISGTSTSATANSTATTTASGATTSGATANPPSTQATQRPSQAAIVTLSNGAVIKASVVKATDNIASHLLPTSTIASNSAPPTSSPLRANDQLTLHILSTSTQARPTAPTTQDGVKITLTTQPSPPPNPSTTNPTAPNVTTPSTPTAPPTASSSAGTLSPTSTPQNASITAQTTHFNAGTNTGNVQSSSNNSTTTPTMPRSPQTQDAIRAYQNIDGKTPIAHTSQNPSSPTAQQTSSAPTTPTITQPTPTQTPSASTTPSSPMVNNKLPTASSLPTGATNLTTNNTTPASALPTGSATTPTPSATQVSMQTPFTATVVGTDKSGEMLLQSPLGTLKISTPIPLPNGASLTLEAIGLTASSATRGSEETLFNSPSSMSAQKAQLAYTFGEIATLEKQHQLSLTKHVIPETSTTESGKKAFIAKMLWFVGNAYSTHSGTWIGSKATERFDAIKARTTLGKLEQQWGQAQQHFVETSPTGWNNILIPVSHEDELQFLHFHARRDEDEENDESNIRFVIEADLSTFGEIQLDGLVKQKKQLNQKHHLQMDITIRTHQDFSDKMKNEILNIFETASAITGNKGQLIFKVEEHFPDPTSEPLSDNHNSITV